MIETTLRHLKSANNERLWFSTNVRLAKLYMAAHDYQVPPTTHQSPACRPAGLTLQLWLWLPPSLPPSERAARGAGAAPVVPAARHWRR